MKRCWFGGAALVVLVILGLLSSGWLRYHHLRGAELSDRIAMAVEEENWDQAGALLEELRIHRERGRFPGAVLTNHDPLEQLDSLLALLEGSLLRRDKSGCLDLCIRISRACLDLAEAQKLSLENLL